MRERTTWNRETIKRAAMSRRADPYTMNQDHPQPKADAYVTGGPSEFAEDVHPSAGSWEAEYKGGEVARNEIGMPEMRGDTFNHAEKTASEVRLLKRANLCVKLARTILKEADVDTIEDQSVAFMHMPEAHIRESLVRLGADDDQEGDDQGEEQQKEATLDERIERAVLAALKKAQGQDQGQEQEKQAQQDQGQEQEKQAQGQQPVQQQQGQQQVPVQQQAQQQEPVQQQAQDQQQVPVQQQAQQQVEQQVQQQVAQQQVEQQQVQQQANDMMQMAEGDIEMAPAPIDDIDMGPEDEVLRSLFAQEQEGDDQSQGQQQEGQKQARTMGTRPAGGVSRLGGGVGKTAAKSDVDKLAALWPSAPDVRSVFGG